MGAWLATNFALTGSAFSNYNYMNVAYALYGDGIEWADSLAARR